MNKFIRKISIGSDVNNQLHIVVGSIMGGSEIASIRKSKLPDAYEVWIQVNDNKDVCHWKTIRNMPVIIEYDTKLD